MEGRTARRVMGMACTHRMTRNTGDLQWCPEPPGNGHDKGSAPLQGSEGLIVLLKPGNAGGGKGPWFGYAYPMSEGGKGDWHQPNNSREDPGAQEEALPQGQAGKGALTCACLAANPVREPGALVAHAGFDERSQETWYGYRD